MNRIQGRIKVEKGRPLHKLNKGVGYQPLNDGETNNKGVT